MIPIGIALAPPAADVPNGIDDLVVKARRAVESGLASLWLGQVYDLDALTAWAAVGPRVPEVTVGTAITPIHSRHPIVMSGQVQTVQAATGNRFVLGIGVGHRPSAEDRYGAVYDRPVLRLREYLGALRAVSSGDGRFAGSTLTADVSGWPTRVPGAQAPPVLVAAMGPAMLRATGELADGTITWLAGLRTVADHVVPTLHVASVGRPAPRVVVSLPVFLTDDPDAARTRLARDLALYAALPAYRAVLDREGAAGPADVALIGDEQGLRADIARLADAGATHLVANLSGLSPAEYDRTLTFLGALSREAVSAPAAR